VAATSKSAPRQHRRIAEAPKTTERTNAAEAAAEKVAEDAAIKKISGVRGEASA